MTYTTDDYLTVSVADCKRMGFLKPDTVIRGVIRWTMGGSVCATVGAATDTRGVPVLKLAYTVNGEPRDVSVFLRWKRSNLNPESTGGYYYFVCPVTGKLCRKLYLVDGKFMSRQAFNPLYPKQTKSHRQRNNPLFCFLDAVEQTDAIRAARYRRETYRGNPTPWGRHVAKVLNDYRRLSPLFL